MSLYSVVAQRLGSNILKRRTERGLSRPQLAALAETSLMFIHKLESAEAVSLKTICNVAESLGMTDDELLEKPVGDSGDLSILEEVLK